MLGRDTHLAHDLKLQSMYSGVRGDLNAKASAVQCVDVPNGRVR